MFREYWNEHIQFVYKNINWFPAINCHLYFQKDTHSKVNVTNIAYFLELNQVGLQDEDALWAHSDPVSKKKLKNIGPKVG